MLSALKKHPFAVEAFFEYSLVLTYAFPKEYLEKLLPECFTLDTFNNHLGFIAVAMVKTKNLRPKGFPKILGNDFILVGYRLFVTYRTNDGKRLRGLYILKSDTNKKSMQVLGNIFTHYNYNTIDIQETKQNNKITIVSTQANLRVEVETNRAITLPQGSPFKNWKEARRFAGPLPFTFNYDLNSAEVLIIEGVRENWIPQPIEVNDHQLPFLYSGSLSNGILASAFMIENVPYQWKKGILETWRS